jgi:hypothetical protein
MQSRLARSATPVFLSFDSSIIANSAAPGAV